MVKFVKHGDLSRALAEKHINGCGCSRDMFSTTAYFDIEKGAWRSLRWGGNRKSILVWQSIFYLF